MSSPERSLGATWPRVAWRWAANSVTVCILGLGVLAAAWAVAWRANGQLAAGLIVVAALVDGTDGALARRAGGPTRTGAILDIVADLTAFGLAPASLLLSRTQSQAGPPAVALAVALGVYLAAALARLVRSARLSLSKPTGLYVGLPMPTAGCLLTGLALNLPALWVAALVMPISLLAISWRPYPTVPWLWQQRRASLLIFLLVTSAVVALSPRAGLLFGAAVCAAYPWARPVRD